MWAVRFVGVGFTYKWFVATISAVDLVAVTGTAFPVAIWPYVGVLCGVFVAVGTVGFSGFHGSRMPTRFDGVLHVLARCAPVQILQAVVFWVVITMKTVHPFGARADEDFQDKNVNWYRPALSIPIQNAGVVPSGISTSADLRLGQHLPFD